ncbi:MAG: nucleotidyltransferase substrate binding protein [Gammaproteobacteria bacterium]|nr:nucleotidyltransferase substrate binding protein [Gammaproteobacteria bacterium]
MKDETKNSFTFFSNALQRFDEALAQDLSNPLAIDGSIQRFEFCFELGWKLVKKMLMDIEGLEALSPKKSLQLAFLLGWIDDEQVWLKMLNDRNLTSHTYREEYALEIYSHLPAHLKNMRLLQNYLNDFVES